MGKYDGGLLFCKADVANARRNSKLLNEHDEKKSHSCITSGVFSTTQRNGY